MTEARPLQEEGLEQVEGELLPQREAMSVISSGFDDPMPLPLAEPMRVGEQL